MKLANIFRRDLAPHGMAGLNAVRKDLTHRCMSSNQPGNETVSNTSPLT